MTKTSNLPVNPTELLKKQLAAANERVGQSDAKRVKITIAGFVDPSGSTGPELDVTVIDYTLIHAYYDKPYDADLIIPPVCYANNRIFMELGPHPDAPKPQNPTCGSCAMNRFKSAPNGKAKACRNSRLLAIVPSNNIEGAPMWTFSVAPTSTSRWDNYCKELMRHNLTPMFARTKMTFEVAGTYAKPVIELIEPLDKTGTAAAISRLDEARELLDMVPDWSGK